MGRVGLVGRVGLGGEGCSMLYLFIYIVGVAIGLIVMRDRWLVRVVTAVAWPLGPAAFLFVLTVLLAATVILWPLPILGAAGTIALVVWFLL